MSKTKMEESAGRGQTIRVETGRDRSDDYKATEKNFAKDTLKGDNGDLSHSLSSGKVPRD